MKRRFIPSPAFRAFMHTCADEAKEILDLKHFRSIFDFVPAIKPYSHVVDPDGYTFEMSPDFTYNEIRISISRAAQRRFDRGELRVLREDMIHEFCHVLTWPITAFEGKRESEEFTDLDENLTQRIAMIAGKLLR